jgi:hypothetical protein
MQFLKLATEACLVVLPCQPVHTRGGVLLEIKERFLELFDADVVERAR